MKQLLFLSVLLFIFSCETEPIEGFDETSDEAALVFPDAECGEVVIESEGAVINLIDDVYVSDSGCDITTRMFGLHAGIVNPDMSSVYILVRVSNPDIGIYNFEETTSETEQCDSVSLAVFFRASETAEAVIYSSRANYGGFGTIEITEYAFTPSDGFEGVASGYIDVTVGIITDDDSSDFINIRGTFNKLYMTRGCDSPFC